MSGSGDAPATSADVAALRAELAAARAEFAETRASLERVEAQMRAMLRRRSKRDGVVPARPKSEGLLTDEQRAAIRKRELGPKRTRKKA